MKTLLTIICCLALWSGTVQACPMCKAATESPGAESQPAAYMASILTMLTMPTILFGVMGVTLYRLSQQEQIAVDRMESGESSEQS